MKYTTIAFILFIIINVCFSYRRSFESLARLAFEHGTRVNEYAACREPKPQLSYFTDASKVCMKVFRVHTNISF